MYINNKNYINNQNVVNMNLVCTYSIPTLPFKFDVETKEILKHKMKKE